MTEATAKPKTPRKRKPAAVSKVTFSTEFITPEKATDIVENHNPNNRRVDRGNINKLAAMMQSGEWIPGLSIIKFDGDGNLVDGQHTLYAIEKAETGQWLQVMRGVPSKSLSVINTGKRLTLTDHPDIKNLANRGTISALVYFIYKHNAGQRGQQLFGDITNYTATASGSITELLKVFEANKEDIVAYAALGAKVSRALPITASTVAQAAWLFYSLDPEGADEFFDALTTGSGLETDSPIYVLRERIIMDLSNKNVTKRPKWVVLAYIIKAWNFYQNGESIQRLRYDFKGAKVEPFPEPIFVPRDVEEPEELDNEEEV